MLSSSTLQLDNRSAALRFVRHREKPRDGTKHAAACGWVVKWLRHLMQRALLSLGLAWHGRVGLQTLWGGRHLILTLTASAPAHVTVAGGSWEFI